MAKILFEPPVGVRVGHSVDRRGRDGALLLVRQ